MRRPPARLLFLNLVVLFLEPAFRLLYSHSLFDEVSRPILLVDASAVPLHRALDEIKVKKTP
jgi:hypothetical protein